MKKQIIDKSYYHKCYKCGGLGFYTPNSICEVCQGTGKYKEEFYHLIVDNGKNKIAFGIDSEGK